MITTGIHAQKEREKKTTETLASVTPPLISRPPSSPFPPPSLPWAPLQLPPFSHQSFFPIPHRASRGTSLILQSTSGTYAIYRVYIWYIFTLVYIYGVIAYAVQATFLLPPFLSGLDPHGYPSPRTYRTTALLKLTVAVRLP